MIDTLTAAAPPPDPDAEPEGGGRKAVVLGIAVVVAVVGGFLLIRWLRRGGAERVARELAEHEAVTLADAVVDRLFAA